MFHYTDEQLASLVALPTVTVLLVWTAAVFHKNRKHWGPYDVAVVAILVLSVVRNLTVLSYTLFVTLSRNSVDVDYCTAIVWIFNSVHTFQASSLTTLAVIGLFAVKLHRKRQRLRHFLTATHLLYHLFCLTTLCACVGVAAILARDDRGAAFKNLAVFDANPCKFMPFDLDLKYNVFVIVLNVFLACVSFVSFAASCLYHCRTDGDGFDYLKKSNSDLSDLSLGTANENAKNYYDTYTIQRGSHQLDRNYYEGQNNNGVWNSDLSNISTTVSSTNSRRPCIVQQQPVKTEEEDRTGLETIHPVLIVCYLFYHLPLIVLCIYPDLVAPWPIAGVALWLGLVQDLLIPIGLSIVDSRFCKWVSNVYKCSDRHGSDKLPHVGLDGKFRPFSSPPQSLEVAQSQQIRSLQTVEHRFPITNGSLYTSIDGRLPVIHNYRRHKDQRCPVAAKPGESVRFDHVCHHQEPFACRSCETDLRPSHSDLHHLSPQYINKQLHLMHQQQQQQHRNGSALVDRNPPMRTSLSQESLRYLPESQLMHRQEPLNNPIMKNSRNLVRLNKMRLCKSEDSLNEISRDLREFKENPEIFQKSNTKKSANEQILDYSSSDEDYSTDQHQNRNFDTMSSRSSYSITTEANCDFEFFQSKETPNVFFKEEPEVKRSLENLTSIVECHPRIQRSSSYMNLEDRKRNKNCKKLLRSNSKLSDCTHNIRQKIKSVEYLPSSNASTVFIEDVYYFNYPNQRNCGEMRNYVGSVPDLKKVFISEYI